ncbi:MAG: PHP domain-containing protein [Candidatus Thorarchaeota archaeon]
MDPANYDLHIHSDYSDGLASVRDIAKRASSEGLNTIAICDHFWPCLGSRKAGGKWIEERRDKIWNLRTVFKPLRILDGAEVDISSDGSHAEISAPLDSFDIVIGSIHFSASSTQWRSTIQKALNKWHFDILAHWDGYLTSFREEDGLAVARALADNGVAVELSAHYVSQYTEFFEMARDAGCEFTLGSDSHRLEYIGKLDDQIQQVRSLNLPLKKID